MISVRLKLVAYFVLLSLLPLAAIFWGFSSVAQTGERSRVDARLQAGLRATLADYADELARASRAADGLATNVSFREALRDRNVGALHTLLRDSPEVSVEARGGFHVGQRPRLAAQREAAVYDRSGELGRVVVSSRLDTAFLQRLQRRSGLEPRDALVLVEQGIVVAGDHAGASLLVRGGGPRTLRVGGERYRVIAAALREPVATQVAVLSPQASIEAASARDERRLLAGIAGSLLLIALAAYVIGRSITRTLARLVAAAGALARGELAVRVDVRGRDELAAVGRAFNEMATQLELRVAELEAERGRLRDAAARLGDALAATHDVDLLLPVIVDTAVQATSASAGWIEIEGQVAHAVGTVRRASDVLCLPLQAGPHLFGMLVLVGDGFSEDERDLAATFAGEAVIALENARLHGIVERQAAQDGLTGLANRRHTEDALATELTRVDRFEGSVGLVLADLDDFKQVNDRYGHPTGDAVLREFAAVARATIREVDLAGRWGGEEFALVLPGADLAGAAQLAERVRAAFERRLVLAGDGSALCVTASFGVAAALGQTTQDALVAAADAALYEAKRSGKNRVVVAGEPAPVV